MTMMDLRKLLTVADLEETTVRSWVAVGWLTPQRTASGWIFFGNDLARARLLRDLVEELRLNDEEVNAILDLLDQIGALRQMQHALLSVAHTLPETLRRRIAVEILDGASAGDGIQEPPRVRYSGEPRRHIRL
jgi:chaperone modulatory protein CbpM